MELNTIIQIRELRDRIRKKLKSVDNSQFSDDKFGEESEYSFKGLIGGIDTLLTDISTLTKYNAKFVKLSSYDERQYIISKLNEIDEHFEIPSSYLIAFQDLKLYLRRYSVRNFSERQIQFEEEIDNVLKIKLNLENSLKKAKKLNSDLSDLIEEINESHTNSKTHLNEIYDEQIELIKNKEKLVEHSEHLSGSIENLHSINSQAEQNLKEIENTLIECKSNEKLINTFSTKVMESEKLMLELDKRIEDNNHKIIEYEDERQEILIDAEKLIKSAKEALNYKTAEGISSSFQKHYESANNAWLLIGWIIMAFVCLVGAAFIGVWILQSDISLSNIGALIGRITLLPLPILGAVFCANQYTKQKNIIEDYAYKMVLSKAIVGFSEQLKKNGSESQEEYVNYITTALGEIHKDPLRSRKIKKENKENSTHLNELIDIAEKIVSISNKS